MIDEANFRLVARFFEDFERKLKKFKGNGASCHPDDLSIALNVRRMTHRWLIRRNDDSSQKLFYFYNLNFSLVCDWLKSVWLIIIFQVTNKIIETSRQARNLLIKKLRLHDRDFTEVPESGDSFQGNYRLWLILSGQSYYDSLQ